MQASAETAIMVGRSFLAGTGLSDIRDIYSTGNVDVGLGGWEKRRWEMPPHPSRRHAKSGASGHRDDAANLLDGAGHVREDVVRVGADQPDRPHDDHENDGQHHGVLGDVLALFVSPKLAQ
jgi:hypothetical protein